MLWENYTEVLKRILRADFSLGNFFCMKSLHFSIGLLWGAKYSNVFYEDHRAPDVAQNLSLGPQTAQRCGTLA